jgi:hypothetical protein
METSIAPQIAHCVRAEYTAQRIPEFQGNPLIEALPPPMSDKELLDALTRLPEFAPEQREWPAYERMHMLESLQNFMVPFARHIELARALDSILRAGYVGRAPRTPGHAEISQKIYERQKAGVSFRQGPTTRAAQLSTSLIGISGIGKTMTTNRWFAHIPSVIYHSDFHLYQVPYLHVEMPSDGSSIKGLAHGILQKLDGLIPGANYYDEYTARGRTGADSLMRSVARVMNIHLVGMLICDEVQNLMNSHKGGQTVMTELVSACNDLHVPILFIGTNKAAKILSLDFRQSRRASGHGITPWDRFPSNVAPGEVDEWAEFIAVLWRHQWVRKPVPLNDHLREVMYHYSQGVIDIAIKLFASSQGRAMLDGSEEITPELIADIYRKELKLVHPMVEALRNNDIEALAEFDDIAPIGLSEILNDINRKMKSKASPLYAVKAGDPSYLPRVASSLVAAGFDDEEAMLAAEATTTVNPPFSVLEGTKAAIASLTKPARVSSKKRSADTSDSEAVELDGRPDDYRNAIQAARRNGSSVLDELKRLGMVRQLEQLLRPT